MFIRAFIILAAIAALLAFPAIAEGKTPRKPSGAKVHMCESVDVYSGAVDASHKATRIAEACRDVAPAAAQKAIVKCQAENNPASCEVLFSADKKTLFIERKIVVSADESPEATPAIASEGSVQS